ncbi:SNF2 family N-terminal domain-containing protein [Umbelopsis sp. PMI_123]|nr:SNF2 family N-terminal domain-containing protein [Umbelopsis sp. PMI_123]
MEHEIDVVSEGADTPTFASLHGQFADMNVVQEDTTTHEQSPKYTHPSISSLINHSEDEDNVRELKEKEVDAEDLDVDADVDGDLTGYAEQLDQWRSDQDEDLEASDQDEDDDDEDQYLYDDDWESEESSPEPDDDDDSDYMESSRKRKKGPAKSRKSAMSKKRPRAHTPEAIRFSTRQRTETQYNEDEYDIYGLESENEEIGSPSNHPLAEEDEGDVIEAVLDHRRCHGTETGITDIPERNLEFLVKWKGYAHIHNTWSTYDYLQDFKGFRKLENYIRNSVLEDKAFRRNPETTMEDIEIRDINLERHRQEIETWKQVDRVIAMRGTPPESEYLCKWKSLHYDESTWESYELVSSDFQAEMDAFLDRQQSQNIPSKSAALVKNRPAFAVLREQPAFITGGELRDYQLHGVSWLYWLWCTNSNGIIADEMGLGKTIQTITFLSLLYHKHNFFGPFLLVVPLSTTDNWMNELAQWAPEFNAICYLGNQKARQTIRDHEWFQPNSRKLKINVVVTTYEIALKDRSELGQVRWQYLAVDEAHRLKNADSQLYEALLDFNTTNRLLITGTPLQNSVKELLALVRFLNPEMITSELEIDLSKPDEDQEAKIKMLHEKLNKIMLRRLKKDVERSLPNKVERILRVEMSPMQTHYYKNILTKNYAALSGSGEKKQWLNIAMELRKASNHPYLFPEAERKTDDREEQLRGIIGNSGKMVLLDKLLAKFKQDGHRVLIFSQLVMILDILSDYMAMRGHPHQRLDGSMNQTDRNKAIEHFNAPDSPDFVFLLSTRAGGMGINLTSADTVIIFDSDWNPQNDLQAMSRAHRIGQTKSVNVYRFISKGTMEEDLIERAKRKMVLEYCIIKQMDTSGMSQIDANNLLTTPAGKSREVPFDKSELAAILKFGAQNMFQASDKPPPKLDDMDLDDILARAEHTETLESGGGQTLGDQEFLAQFQVSDFGSTEEQLSWEEIIPDAERKAAQEEERIKAEMALFDRAARKRMRRYAEQDDIDREKKSSATQRKRRKATQDPSGLSRKHLLAIVNAVKRFGDISNKLDRIIEECDLDDIDPNLVLELSQDLISCCSAVSAVSSKGATGQGLIDWRDIKQINAAAINERVEQFELLDRRLGQLAKPEKFRFSAAVKAVRGWACAWGQKDDALLLVGIYLHGFANWISIAQDTTLGLGKKFASSQHGDDDAFTDTKKRGKAVSESNPKPAQLVRRVDYLLKVLAEEDTRDKKRTGRKASSKSAATKKATKTKSRSLSRPKRQQATKDSEQSSGDSGYDEDACTRALQAVQEQLVSLRDEGAAAHGRKKAALIRDRVSLIGAHIDELVDTKPRRAREGWRKQMWTHVKQYWPSRRVSHRDIMEVYERVKGEGNRLSDDDYKEEKTKKRVPGRRAAPGTKKVTRSRK